LTEPTGLAGIPLAGRYLTSAGKDAALKVYADHRETLITPLDDRGGRGFPDTDIVPWCDRLNAMPGVCTLQSCAGHRRDGYLTSGHLWLWLAPDVCEAFRRRAFELARLSPPIERVTTRYAAWGQEIACVEFAGNERDRLAESMRVILAFFSDL
jgi:hypothetical protein